MVNPLDKLKLKQSFITLDAKIVEVAYNNAWLKFVYYVCFSMDDTWILVQLVLVVDFAYAWNEKFLEKAEEGNGHKGWYIGE